MLMRGGYLYRKVAFPGQAPAEEGPDISVCPEQGVPRQGRRISRQNIVQGVIEDAA